MVLKVKAEPYFEPLGRVACRLIGRDGNGRQDADNKNSGEDGDENDTRTAVGGRFSAIPVGSVGARYEQKNQVR